MTNKNRSTTRLTLLGILAFTLASAACVVDATDPPGVDNTGGSPDAGVAADPWTALSDDSAAAGSYLHWVSATELYAVIGGDKICKWNGTAWIPVTEAVVGLGPTFHYVSDSLIYAIIGQQICKWDGIAWAPLTLDNANLRAAHFHFVSETAIYAFIGQQICVWDGEAWLPVTADNANLVPGGFHYVSDDLIYAVIGQKICKWDGIAWAPLTDDAATMKADFLFESEDSIYAVLGQQICKWDGIAWVPITDDAPVSLTPGFYKSAVGGFYAAATDGMIYGWQPSS